MFQSSIIVQFLNSPSAGAKFLVLIVDSKQLIPYGMTTAWELCGRHAVDVVASHILGASARSETSNSKVPWGRSSVNQLNHHNDQEES